MANLPIVSINTHTTVSLPRPHILDTAEVSRGGNHAVLSRRYSEVSTFNVVCEFQMIPFPVSRSPQCAAAPDVARPGNHAKHQRTIPVKKPAEGQPGSGKVDGNVEKRKNKGATNRNAGTGKETKDSSNQAGTEATNADGPYGEGGGFTEGWDNCSDAPVCIDFRVDRIPLNLGRGSEDFDCTVRYPTVAFGV
ncbi:hypothetical protein F5877DRAFT_86244 [Lentinula edodes]|nr:hypothetical protein F5877DRAFT_86244 [Lentinula edodes]